MPHRQTTAEAQRRLEAHRRWWRAYLAPLEGATIKSAGLQMLPDDDTLEEWPVLIVKTVDGARLEITVSRDAEGNGPGFLFGLPMPNITDEPRPRVVG
ncbi:unnamed protein product [marine sediment metagenome]|uniref:Uncharacterized protein n=1 Tax=marine sediment metagenome TaxID=412755 RepID=X0YYX7_9ZZZZ